MTKVGYFLWGRRHEVLFVGDGFMGTEVHLPPKFSFFSDFGHFILNMLENAKFSYVWRKKIGTYLPTEISQCLG